MKIIYICFLACLIPFVTVNAETVAPQALPAVDSSALFCDALYDEETYEKKYKAYKMLVAGQDGWIFRTSRDLRTDFNLKPSTINYLKDLQNAFEEKDITFVMLFAPTRGLIHHDKIAKGDLEKFGFTQPDQVWSDYLTTVKNAQSKKLNIVGLPQIELGADFFYKRDHHWNPTGAKRTAEELAKAIKEMPVYETLSKEDFTTREIGPYDFSGTSDKVFKNVCDTIQPPEKITKFVTEKTETAVDSDDLFGSVAEPEVVLLGTSNSTMEPSFANFEGFLKEQLSTDILNMSVSGGGIDTAMISYLNSDHFKENKAKLVIWEVPGYYDLNNHIGFYRQATPAISNDCGSEALVEEVLTLKGNTPIILTNLEGKNIQGSEYYLYLKFSEAIKKRFTVDFRYIKNRDKYTLKRSNRYPHDTEFYLELKNSKKADLEKVILEIPKELEGLDVTAKICKKN